ncbi:MAG: hypothetical protein ACREDR_24145, partial [Blastocatellia bacterium]
MNNPETEMLLGRTPASEFVGREAEVERVCRLTGGDARVRSAILLGAPRSGKTELLRKTFDRLFFRAGEVAPIYHCFRPDRLTPVTLAHDYLAQFLSQFIAFRRGDPKMIQNPSEPLDSIALQAAPSDFLWIKAIVEKYGRALAAADEVSALAISVTAPA